jgi:hypothetical protein
MPDGRKMLLPIAPLPSCAQGKPDGAWWRADGTKQQQLNGNLPRLED